MTEKSEPCECGNTLISLGKMRKDGLWHAVCLCCRRYDVIGHKTKKEAIAAWNRRAGEEK